MRKWIVLPALICALAHSGAQEQKPLADAGVATCHSPSPGGPTSAPMSAWVKSATGNGFAAAVELRQRITGTGPHRVCRTTWVLHVRKEGDKARAIEVAEREDSPGDNEWTQENSFELEAWSADGNLLLAAQIEAQGDWDVTTPILYDFTSGTHRRLELGPIFDQMTPANCSVVYRPLRLDDAGNLIISAMSADDDREPGTPACFPKSLWRFDLHTNNISHMRPASKPRPEPLPNLLVMPPLPVPPKTPN
jgi:hypothetical protein